MKSKNNKNTIAKNALNDNQLAAVVYADLFDYPLTIGEAKLWEIRKIRQEVSARKLIQAREIAWQLKVIPTIVGVFATGSVAANNAKKGADIDLMIITFPTTLWMTRLVVFIWLKLLGKLKNPYCPNIFLDLNHLEIQEKNLFTAHEILQAKCLYDRGEVERLWLQKNIWVKDYLPKAFEWRIKNCKSARNLKLEIKNRWLWPLELIAFGLQYWYMKSRITNERVGWGHAFFHPKRRGEKILRLLEKRLAKIKARRYKLDCVTNRKKGDNSG